MRKSTALEIAGVGAAVFGAAVAETTMIPVIAGIAVAAAGLKGEQIEEKKERDALDAYERRMHRRIDYRVGADDKD